MKKIILLIAFITLPVLTFAQNDGQDHQPKEEAIIIEIAQLQTSTEDELAFGTFSKNEVTNLSYKKSNELISIKAYRKSLQIKVKEVRSC